MVAAIGRCVVRDGREVPGSLDQGPGLGLKVPGLTLGEELVVVVVVVVAHAPAVPHARKKSYA